MTSDDSLHIIFSMFGRWLSNIDNESGEYDNEEEEIVYDNDSKDQTIANLRLQIQQQTNEIKELKSIRQAYVAQCDHLSMKLHVISNDLSTESLRCISAKHDPRVVFTQMQQQQQQQQQM